MLPQEQINTYIAEQDEWKRRTLVRLRQLIHQADPGIEETWRWDKPHFDHQGIMIGMSAFKQFVSVWFHKGNLIKDPKKLFEPQAKGEEKGMRAYKIHEGEAINEEAFSDLVAKAIALNGKGATVADARPARKALVVPEDLEAVLRKDPTAWANWDAFTYSHKREYAEWVADAKKDETRKRRIAQALERIREGLGQNARSKA
jgi:hypothetical protein